MTRLKEDWIKNIGTTIKDYEKDLISKTGMDFMALASAAGDIAHEKIVQASKSDTIGVIPITTGLGIIGSFSESVAAILRCMNFEAFVTENTDVAGIFEAHQRGAGIIFLADDNKFVAINLKNNIIAENSQATARGYVAALEGAVAAHECAAGNLKTMEVLVIGCGVVGREVLIYLRHKGAIPIAYDIKESVLSDLENEGFCVLSDKDKISEYPLVIDASSEGGWIKKGMLHPNAWIVTPGVPLSLNEEAHAYHKDRVKHDYLPIGVAVMLAMSCK